MTLSWHRTHREDGCEDLAETFHQMLLLPHVPHFCPAPCDGAKGHQRIAARRTLLNKEADDGTKSWTVTLASTRRHVKAPWGIMQNQRFFPRRGLLFFPINRQGVMAFACKDDFGKPSTVEPLSEWV